MHQEILNQLNEQINREFFSAYLYLDISNYYASENLDGFANWFQVQAQEERDHAMMFLQYLRDHDAKITLKEIGVPKEKFSSIEEPLAISLAHEQSVTAAIHRMYDNAMQAKDFCAMQFLNWFITEQSEEERTAKGLCDKMAMIGSKRQGLYMMDSELKARTYTAPAAERA